MAKYLIDTCIFVDLIRGKLDKVKGLDDLDGAVVSYVTYGELLQGANNKKEITGIEEIVSGYKLIWENGDLAKRAISILKIYHQKCGIEFFDAIIAATALENNWILITENIRHFRQIDGLIVKKLSEVV